MSVVILFGFSGAGKSTLANVLGDYYSLRVVHPSGILRNLLENRAVVVENSDYNKGFWESEEGIALFKSRLYEKEPLDLVSDRILLQEVEKGNVVIDSWSLPWLTTQGINIYLQADLEIRSQRVSLRSNISYEKALEVVAMKDEETRRLFQRVYGFDIMQDHHVFDYTVNTNRLTKEEVLVNVCEYLNKMIN